MRSAYVEEARDDDRARLRRRAIGFLLAVAVELLVVIVLLTLGPPKFGVPGGDGKPKTFTITQVAEKNEAKKTPQKKRAAKVTKAVPPPPPSPPVPPPTPLGPIPGLLTLTREQYIAADIGKIKSTRAEVADAAPEGDSADDSQVAGTGPNGEPLFDAEWYREPTEAQMAFYLPKGLRGGSALIACKTAPRYKVVDCVLLGESPPGTGLARGVREASWQFQVRPPRKGGKQLMGAWVRIRFDLIERKR